MSVVERDPQTRPQPEDAIFVARDGRRARQLKRAAIVTAVFAILWVVGLGVGMMGFGSLPGVSFLKGGHKGAGKSARIPDQVVLNGDVGPHARDAGARLAQGAASSSSRASALQKASAKAKRAHAARRSSRPAGVPAAPQTPANPAQRTRGWARRGNPVPPGKAHKAAPPPPPAQSHGQRRGQTTTTTTPTVPPGQAKKAAAPPPPPPKKA